MANGTWAQRRVGGPYPGPADSTLRQEWSRERHAVVRRHHPDRGGDAGAMQQHLENLDNDYESLETSLRAGFAPAAPAWQPVTRSLRRARRRVDRLARSARARIPSGWPGHRHYFDL